MYFPNWAKNILFLLVYMISGLVLAIIIEGLLSGAELLPFNDVLEQAMDNIRTPFLTSFLVLITNIGSPFILSCVAAFLTVILIVRGNTYDALLIVVAVIVSILSFTALKNTFQITRPDSPFYEASGWSFPSGHATVATAFFFVLAHSFFSDCKTVTGKVLLIVGSVFGTALISLSRLYLGAHWALDILAGITLGLLSVSFTVLVFSIFLGDGRWGIKRRNL